MKHRTRITHISLLALFMALPSASLAQSSVLETASNTLNSETPQTSQDSANKIGTPIEQQIPLFQMPGETPQFDVKATWPDCPYEKLRTFYLDATEDVISQMHIVEAEVLKLCTHNRKLLNAFVKSEEDLRKTVEEFREALSLQNAKIQEDMMVAERHVAQNAATNVMEPGFQVPDGYTLMTTDDMTALIEEQVAERVQTQLLKQQQAHALQVETEQTEEAETECAIRPADMWSYAGHVAGENAATSIFLRSKRNPDQVISLKPNDTHDGLSVLRFDRKNERARVSDCQGETWVGFDTDVKTTSLRPVSAILDYWCWRANQDPKMPTPVECKEQ